MEINIGKVPVFNRVDNSVILSGLIERFKLEEEQYKKTTRVRDFGNDLIMLYSPHINDLGFTQYFSTRLGGVSQGIYSSLNLSFDRGDNPACVLENYQRVGKAIELSCNRMIYTHQTHTNKFRCVTGLDAGAGITRPKFEDDVDGLISDEKNLGLITTFADCVPVIVVDKERKVVASLHSGWKGTVTDIPGHAIKTMLDTYSCKTSDLVAYIGPSICETCYEVSQDLIEQFESAYPIDEWELLYRKGRQIGNETKYQLNLWSASFLNLVHAGLDPKNIYINDICTCMNQDLLFSHRASMGKRGNLCNFIYIN